MNKIYKYTIVALLKRISKHNFYYIKCQILCLLLGFLVATILSTLPAQTGDWGIIAGSIIITVNEIISKLVYGPKKNIFNVLMIMNYIKIGIIYGLFVDAFKLGS